MQPEGLDEERHETGRVGFQGQADQVVHQLAGDRQFGQFGVLGLGTWTTGLGLFSHCSDS